MSKMSKDFKIKSSLRHMADGGAPSGNPDVAGHVGLAMRGHPIKRMAEGGVPALAGLRQRTIDSAVDGPRPAPVAAAPAPAPVAPVPVNGMISDGVVSRPAPAPAPPPAPSIWSRLRSAVGMEGGGTPGWDSAYKPGGSLGARLMQPAAPTPGVLPSALAPAAAAPTPVPALAPVSPSPALATPTAPTVAPTQPAVGGGTGREMTAGEWSSMAEAANNPSSLRTAGTAAAFNSAQNAGNQMSNPGSILHAGPFTLPSSNPSPQHSYVSQTDTPAPAGYSLGKPMAIGGEVQGPGGPREDKVGPVMLSNKEYVLPAKAATKLASMMGGKEELDEFVAQANDGRKPMGAEEAGEKTARGSMLRAASGLVPWDPVSGQPPAPGGGLPEIEPWRLPATQGAAGAPPNVEVPPAGAVQPARGPTNWDNVNRVYGQSAAPASPSEITVRAPVKQSPEMAKFLADRSAPQLNAANEAVRAAQAAAAPAAEAAAPVAEAATQAAKPGFLKAASSFGGSALRGTVGATKFIAKAGGNPYVLGGMALADSRDVGAESDVLRAPDGSVSNMYTGQDLTPAAKAMSSQERYLLMQRVNNGDQMAKQELLGANPTNVQVDPTAKYGGSSNGSSANLHPQDPSVTAAIQDNALKANELGRNAPNTGGQIVQDGNRFFGGDPNADLTAKSAAEGRQRYTNDASGMYAAIQGHIANGDIETAAKLAWDPQSRALVNQGYAQRSAAMAASQNYSDPEKGINDRYNSQISGLKKIFSSDKAQGNLAKHIDSLEGRRAMELGAARNTAATVRGQDVSAQTNQARIISERLLAQQRLNMEQSNRDREYNLNVNKYGTDVAKNLYDRQRAVIKDNQDWGDKHTQTFFQKDGKADPETHAKFREFFDSHIDPDFYTKPRAEQESAYADALTKFRANENTNANQGMFFGKQNTQYSAPVSVHKMRLDDLGHVPMTSAVRAGAARIGVGNADIVTLADGRRVRATDLGTQDDVNIHGSVYGGKGLRREQ